MLGEAAPGARETCEQHDTGNLRGRDHFRPGSDGSFPKDVAFAVGSEDVPIWTVVTEGDRAFWGDGWQDRRPRERKAQ